MQKLPGGNETILLVDDQETVWDFLIEALQNLGYSVILAENGLDAVEICKQNPGEIDLVLLYMIMPKLGGHGAFYQIKEVDPNIKILLYTPYVLQGSATVNAEDPKKWEFFRDGCAEKAEAIKRIAKDYPVGLCVTQPLFDAAERVVAADQLLCDGVHPSIAGGEILARGFMDWFKTVK